MTTDHHPTSKPFTVSRAELSRRLGVSPGRITQLMGTRLSAAGLPGGRVDAAHHAVVAYAGERRVSCEVLLAPGHHARRPAPVAAGRRYDVSVAELARLAGIEGNGEAPQNVIDLGSSKVLELMAAHPFRRDAAGEPIDVPAGMLAPACVGDDIDLDHPSALAFFARLLGCVVTGEELAARSAEIEARS